MENLDSFEKIIDFAINEEQKAYDFYMLISKKAKADYMKKVFEEYANEETLHKRKLETIKENREFTHLKGNVPDLKLSTHVKDDDMVIDENLDYQQALIIAMNAEKRAFQMYTKLAENSTDEKLREIFEMMAQEEAKHKLRFETEYDEIILQEN